MSKTLTINVLYKFEYDLKDHLGNTRVSFSIDTLRAVPLQYKNYYPFGMEMAQWYKTEGAPTKYLYNGKELQDEFGLDWYDYGARFYDPALGRFHTVDPMAEDYYLNSVYGYANNNPIRFIDFMGMNPEDPPKVEIEIEVPPIIEQAAEIVSEVIDDAKELISNTVDAIVETVTDQDNLTDAGRTTSVTETVTDGKASSISKGLNKASKIVAPIITTTSIAVDAAETDFSNPVETGNFIENTAQTSLEAVPVVGPALGVHMDDAKKSDGLTNLNNGRLSNDYKASYNQIHGYLQQSFINRNKKLTN